ncbi:amidohydrolase [Microbulbifer agarilyticus]|uniref:amidohydrolase n=1 Tax=Microbulbifer agarilyticus TaxID=260552 RepID=UPI001C944BBF|nr:amidohydrolase [Microbulbifer agarilyticus]MBY6191714.1 amidohydrolase [Microbulbifer agarilyticus]
MRSKIRQSCSQYFLKLSFISWIFLFGTLTSAAPQHADILFTNGKVYTMNPAQPWAESVAITGNKITYVGDAEGASKFVGNKTKQIDLKGKMLLPGFFSAHEHLIASGWMALGAKLGEAKSKSDYLEIISKYAEDNPDEEFIRGSGWNPALMDELPTAKDLDAIVPDRPVILLDYTMHDMWMNSKAMELGGVNKDTEDPVPGLIEWVRDEKGNPTGYAKEFAWMDAFIESGAWQADKMIEESQRELYDLAASFGYTGYVNQGLITPNIKSLSRHFDDYKTALKLLDEQRQQGTLKLRTFMQVLYKTDAQSVDQLVENARTLKGMYDTELIRVAGIKIHPEGVHTSHASVMIEPFTDKPGKKVKRGVSAQRTDEVIKAANKAGFDVSVHVDGSQTVRDTIDSFLASKKDGNVEARNTLQHFTVVHPDDMKRVLENKIPVNITPIWATTWSGGMEATSAAIGEERTLKYFQQIRTAIDGGTNVSISADVPSTNRENMGALTQCEAAITRRDPSNPSDQRVFPPMSQAITLEQCLQAVTLGGAYEARMEDKVGSIEVGKYADLVILEKNIFDVKPSEIADTKVVGTMMDGRFTFRDGL